MTGAQLLFLVIVFAVVVALALLAWLIFFPGTLRQRLFGFMAPAASGSVAEGGWVERRAGSGSAAVSTRSRAKAAG